jgi:FkbM family methyltransferase
MDALRHHGLWLPASDAKIFDRYAEFEGLLDLDVSKVAKCVALSPRFGTALDIGAHVGAVSVYLARKFARVIAFEAVPSTFEFLDRNTAELDNVDARHVAVGPVADQIYLTHYPKHGQLSHIVGSRDEPKTVQLGPITQCAIDDLELEEVSFIKIDVEGFELPVLEGARRTIERQRPLLLVEQAGNDEKHYGRPLNEASAFLESMGMTRHRHEPRMSKDRLFTF